MSTSEKKLRITQVKSGIGKLKRQKLTLKALGITKMGHSAVQNDTPSVRGMILAVNHLVNVEEVRGE
ncbi:MAG TPA: 50S ribosomal protein L30 [Fibrobacteres bacterium]|jgi:large subunit ribosomal protein L30|nr:50S ribosomal protein L30 [Fibrobacterota bacterium]